ncbi:DUF421 domain-containing protein [Aquibacillus koreensis]|uniref:DUF421 domain-containing protein n=1 Tax=Aquibacillus koreensis TaxID=279446 RepID=A0A9X3WKD5_9BACI|nr:YetF domain-containing protein [Aquibacillus koreensis]MCT2534400.1 DUF421 domain-containing protein [Aquibacillus koreensis]MDC3421707.1 DUF421 domain-containing protein [Aquibacillus koreensis]
MQSLIQAIIYLVATIILLRLAGKRTISQATPSEVIIMIGIGTVLVHPLKSVEPLTSAFNGLLIVLGVILITFLQMKIKKFKTLTMGQPILLVRDGEILYDNLKKARIPIDELKMKLRIKKINDISKLESVALEVSGDLSVELKDEYSSVTKKDLEELKKAIQLIGDKVGSPVIFYTPPPDPKQNLFNQVEKIYEQERVNKNLR